MKPLMSAFPKMLHYGPKDFNQSLILNKSLVEAFSWNEAPLGKMIFMMGFKYNTEADFPR